MSESPTLRVLGIDAANIRAGGGQRHLVELLGRMDPAVHGFSKVIVWGGTETLRAIGDRAYVVKVNPSALNGGLVRRTLWQRFRLSAAARDAGCDVLYVPGGSFAGGFQPTVASSQNLLPFVPKEARRYGFTLMRLKLELVRRVQRRTMRRADGVIFLTKAARDMVLQSVGGRPGLTVVISHGVDEGFLRTPRAQRSISEYSVERPYRLLYVSIVDLYKHQGNVATAVSRLRAGGIPVTLELVGPAYPPALRQLRNILQEVDPDGQVVRYVGPVPHQELHGRYAKADAFVFASSCESFALILLEAMASAMPIACADQQAQVEVLGDAGIYFDPENTSDIERALFRVIESVSERERMARRAVETAQHFSWKRCTDETFGFLAAVASRHASAETRGA